MRKTETMASVIRDFVDREADIIKIGKAGECSLTVVEMQQLYHERGLTFTYERHEDILTVSKEETYE